MGKRMGKRKRWAALCLAFVLLAAGCGSASRQADPGRNAGAESEIEDSGNGAIAGIESENEDPGSGPEAGIGDSESGAKAGNEDSGSGPEAGIGDSGSGSEGDSESETEEDPGSGSKPGAGSDTEDSGSGASTLEVHYIDVGQGDATLIRQGSHAMLIDAGDNDKGTAVQSYLRSQGVTELEYVIGTHPDSDHVGGMDVILYKFPWEMVFLPDLEKDTKTYQDVLRVIQDQGKKAAHPFPGDTYALGEAEFTVVAPVEKDYGDNWNNYSIGIVVTFGESRFLFTGDAEEEAEADMIAEGLDLSADVMKASHHGSDTANTLAFLEEVRPEFVVVSCGEDNSYGHPRAGALNNFREIGAKLYRTDEQGTIVAVSDGKEISWNCSPSESWKPGEPTGGQDVQPREAPDAGQSQADEAELKADAGVSYIINTNTGKFHVPSCSSVDQMNPENKESTSLSRQELVEQGYDPCGRCRP